jgi:DNA-directed RNA polymerase subunit F
MRYESFQLRVNDTNKNIKYAKKFVYLDAYKYEKIKIKIIILLKP